MKLAILCLCLAGTACALPVSGTFPSYGFIKYSIPQPPGRQSVEVVRLIPYNGSRPKRVLFLLQILPHMPPFSNSPMGQDVRHLVYSFNSEPLLPVHNFIYFTHLLYLYFTDSSVWISTPEQSPAAHEREIRNL
uniref:Uncharacterized protein n=1 Tax=Nothobranchius furzeri TaxID=105023 RepID=A0A8C6KCN4_NOTFU